MRSWNTIVNLKLKGQNERQQAFFEIQRIAVQKVVIQAETQILFRLEDKARFIYEKGKRNKYLNRKKAFYKCK